MISSPRTSSRWKSPLEIGPAFRHLPLDKTATCTALNECLGLPAEHKWTYWRLAALVPLAGLGVALWVYLIKPFVVVPLIHLLWGGMVNGW